MKNHINLKFVTLTLAVTLSTSSLAATYSSFSKAKKAMYSKVYNNQGLTFYANCEWSKKKVDLSSCHLQDSFSSKEQKRAKRTEAEHIIPASWFYRKNGQYRSCYLQAKAQNASARKYCQKNDPEYRSAHNDLVNLRPTVGAINEARSNKPFAEKVSGKRETTYRGSGKTILISSRIVIPDATIRGDIARVALYMQRTYGATYSKRQQKVFAKWNSEDPISNEESRLARKINHIQKTDYLND